MSDVITGRDELSATIGAVQSGFPGFVFTQVGEADAHRARLRFPRPGVRLTATAHRRRPSGKLAG